MGTRTSGPCGREHARLHGGAFWTASRVPVHPYDARRLALLGRGRRSTRPDVHADGQLINASNTTHEMHRHGFFFRIDRRGFVIDSAVPPPPAGTRYRIRMIYIMATDVVMTMPRGPFGLPLARSFGLDASESPNAPLRPVQYPTGPGHTRDVAITCDSPGTYSLTAQRLTGGPTTTVPIRVR